MASTNEVIADEGALAREETADAPAGGPPTDRAGPAEWLIWARGKLDGRRIAGWLVLGLAGLVFLPFLGSLTLWDPWETHYGEVAREMIVRDDYVYPHWESSYFFSKPALPMWLMAIGMLLVGAESAPPLEPLGSLTEWGVRLPFALIAMAGVWGVYRIGRQLRDETTGVLAAIVLMSSAQYIFVGKQAMADMPFVGLLSVGFALFCAAVFDAEPDRPGTIREKVLAGGGIVVSLFGQLALIGREQSASHAILALAGAGAVGALYVGALVVRGSRRDCQLAGFYVLVALAVLAKGPAPLLVVGPPVILYMIITLDWRILLRSKVLLGGPLFLLVAAPWYVTLTLFQGRNGEGKTFTERFWIHDVLNRMASGVHGDRPTVGYYFEQLAYGMFPWSALLPFALVHSARADKPSAEDDAATQRWRMTVFVLLWAAWSYVGFTISKTGFHHYILPAIPPLAVLVALWLVWLAEQPERRLTFVLAIPILALFAVTLRDLADQPNALVNLFTYKYDRDFPREVHPRTWVSSIGVLGLIATAFAYRFKGKGWAIAAYVATAAVFAAWASHHHFNMLSPHWGQGHVVQTFYDERQGDEPLYAYQLNWRGETFYSRNRVLQVKESGANQRIRQLVDRPGREFIITEASRYHTLRSVLSPDKRDKLRILDRSNNKFYLTIVED